MVHLSPAYMLENFQTPIFFVDQRTHLCKVNELAKNLLDKHNLSMKDIQSRYNNENTSDIQLSHGIYCKLLYRDDQVSGYLLQEEKLPSLKYKEMALDIETIFKH